MKTMVTRIGENSKMVINGDPNQTDLKGQLNGFDDLISRYIKHIEINGWMKYIDYVELNETDIVRSEVVKNIIMLYGEELNDSLNTDNETISRESKEPKELNNPEGNDNNSTSSFNSDCALVPLEHKSKYYDENSGFLK